MKQIVFEEHLFYGTTDGYVTISEDLDQTDILRLKVIDANKHILGEYFTSRTLEEEEYAHILASRFNLINKKQPFERFGYRFILQGDILVDCKLYADRVLLHSDVIGRTMNMPFVGMERLREYVCSEFIEGGRANAIPRGKVQAVVC